MILNADYRRAAWALGTLLALGLAAALPPAFAAARDARLNWKKDWGPLVSHKKFPGDCGICHVAKDWSVLRADFQFDHKKETGYALEGAHSEAACLRCHNDRGPIAAYVARSCGGCHVDPHRGSMGLDCKACHNQRTWEPESVFIAHIRAGFSLSGRHASLECVQCHPRAEAGDYRGTPIDCYACHSAQFQAAAGHVATGFPHQCLRCHTSVAWTGARFDHGFLGSISNCYSCHAANYAGAPNHVAMNYPQTCGQCHNTSTWAGAVFNHPFPLTGAHNTSCQVCHTTGNSATFSCTNTCHSAGETNSHHSGVSGYTYTPTSCYTCHTHGQAGN